MQIKCTLDTRSLILELICQCLHFLGLTSTVSVSGLSLEQVLALDLATFGTPREKGTMTEVLAQFV